MPKSPTCASTSPARWTRPSTSMQQAAATDHHLQPGRGRHDDAPGRARPPDARGLRAADPLRAGAQVAARLRRARVLLRAGGAGDRRVRRRRGPGVPRSDLPRGYVFPMRGLPLSYLDKMVAKGVDGMDVELDDETYQLRVRAFPQGRNGIPNPAYDGGRGFTPEGAVSTHQVEGGAARATSTASCSARCRPSTTPGARWPSMPRTAAWTSCPRPSPRRSTCTLTPAACARSSTRPTTISSRPSMRRAACGRASSSCARTRSRTRG